MFILWFYCKFRRRASHAFPPSSLCVFYFISGIQMLTFCLYNNNVLDKDKVGSQVKHDIISPLLDYSFIFSFFFTVAFIQFGNRSVSGLWCFRYIHLLTVVRSNNLRWLGCGGTAVLNQGLNARTSVITPLPTPLRRINETIWVTA